MRFVTAVSLLLAACGPVLLFGDDAPNQPALPLGPSDAGADSGRDAGPMMITSRARDDAPRALIGVKAIDCGRCFDLIASGTGGLPPYRFEWEDGSQSAKRRVCTNHGKLDVSVIVQDANSARSAAHGAQLETDDDASCPTSPPLGAKLCVTNPSFEGVPAMNTGMPEMFDAAPWSTCTNPATTNTPDIGNESVAQTVPPPKATEGNTFLALAEDEQVSQRLCAAVSVGTEMSIELDLSSIDLTGGVAPDTEPVFLEIWGGVAADCLQRQLLWASTPLKAGWKRYCVTLKPTEFMDQITLRAKHSNTTLAPAFLLVDNLVPVDGCP